MVKNLQKVTYRWLLLLATIVFAIQVNGQVDISGVVLSQPDNSPLPGATVMEKGTSNGVISDLDGYYSFSVASKEAIIVVSYIGYLKKEIALDGQTSINIALSEDLLNLDEVVITAYSQKSKTEISSAVVSLKAGDIDQVTVNSVEDMLIGKVAGVQVQSETGQPGASSDIRIRGVGSVFSPQQPLIVVDGIIGGTYNPDDIESVSVLKDAGATGLYGSAAAAGVILIQTKSGKIGTSVIRASIRTGIKQPEFGNYEMMNTEGLYAYHKSFFSPALFPIARPDSLLKYDFDWVNNTYGQSNITVANISASGATEKTNYYISGDYMDDGGTLMGTGYKRVSFRSNIKYQLNKWLNIGTNITFNHSKSTYADWNMSEGVFRLQPWDQPRYPDGELVYDVIDAGWLSNVTHNPYHSAQYNKEGGYDIDGAANLILGIKITDWLKIDSWSTFAMGYGKYEFIYSPRSYEGAVDGGRIGNNVYLDKNISNTTLLKFNYQINKHGIDALLGTEVGSYISERDFGGEAIGFLHGQSVMGVAGSQVKPSGTIVESNYVSLLSQVNYNYAKKYFATLSYRMDGNSRFAPNNKYAPFFTFAASWLISNEGFMEQVGVIHYLKLRASYGAVGNSSFPDDSYYPYFPSFTAGGTYNGSAFYFPEVPGNYNLSWEKSNPLNIGLDIGFINRIEINFDYYNNKTEDLLFMNPLPSSQGYEFQWANVGEIRNTGIEMAINAIAIKTRDFTWRLDLNIAANKNKMLALSDKESVTEMVISRGDPTQILTVGGGAFDWYMPKWLGVDPDNGQPLWEDIIYDDNGNEIDRVPTSVYTDAAEDYQVMGSPFPDFAGGFGTVLAYKGISLNVAFVYSYGNEIYHTNRQELDNDGENISVNAMKLQDGWSRWVNPGDDATHPESVYGGNMNSNKYSSRYLEDGSYLRLRNITLAYDLPAIYAQKIKLQGLRVYFSVDNLKTWTKYSGADPDVPLYLGAYNLPGTQFFKYPISKQFIVGLDISF